jgi:hypothetical protein
VAAGAATASAEAAAANATIGAQASGAAALAATASAESGGAAATITAQSSAGEAAAATASAEAAAANATLTAISGSADAAAATASSAAAAANATIDALSTAQAEASGVAGASLNPKYVELSIQVDLTAVEAGDPAAVDAATKALQEVLRPYTGCKAGVVLTFGHGATIGQGVRGAAAINEIIRKEFPEIFDGAAFDNFGDLTPPLGQADIRIYFFSGCAAAEQ